jgi:hypothetical protein
MKTQDDTRKAELRQFLLERSEDFNGRFRELKDSWRRYMVVMNGGGIVVVFGFIGASQSSSLTQVFIPLSLFTIALVLLSIGIFLNTNRLRRMRDIAYDCRTSLDIDSGENFESPNPGQLKRDYDQKIHMERGRPEKVADSLHILSFALFLAGVIASSVTLPFLGTKDVSSPQAAVNRPVAKQSVDPRPSDAGDKPSTILPTR